MTVTAAGSDGSSGALAVSIWTPQRTPARAPVQGRNFSNGECGMAGSFRVWASDRHRQEGTSGTARPGRTIRVSRETREPFPGVLTPGSPGPQNGGVQHVIALLGGVVPVVVGALILRWHPRYAI